MDASSPPFPPNVCASHGSEHGRERSALRRLFRYFSWIIVAAIAYVLLDFSIDIQPAAVHDSYRFTVPALQPDEVRILRQDNLSVLLIRRSAETRRRLLQTAAASLQDPDSSRSHQPGYARNPLRSRHEEYFVAYALGTDLGCPLQVVETYLRETCGDAGYDFAGRALQASKSFSNLIIPDYNFSSNFSHLTIKP